MKSGKLNFLEPSGPLHACNGTALPFYLQWEPCWYMQTNRETDNRRETTKLIPFLHDYTEAPNEAQMMVSNQIHVAQPTRR